MCREVLHSLPVTISISIHNIPIVWYEPLPAVAQVVEHLPRVESVMGSNPTCRAALSSEEGAALVVVDFFGY